MAEFLNSTSTSASPTDGIVLDPGEWVFTLDTTNASASVTINVKPKGGTNYVPVTMGGAAITLTTTDPAKTVDSNGGTFQVTNADGSAIARVTAERKKILGRL